MQKRKSDAFESTQPRVVEFCGDEKKFKEQVERKQSPSRSCLDLLALPDEVFTRIGKSVADLCGVRDFVALSQTCRRSKKLLLDSRETRKDIIALRTSRASKMFLPSSTPSKPIVIHTLEQLSVLESVMEKRFMGYDPNEANNLLEENRWIIDDLHELHIRNIFDAITEILKQHPTVMVLLDAHPGEHGFTSDEDAIFNTFWTCFADWDSFWVDRGRLQMRVWDGAIVETASRSEHPYGEMARNGIPWVEFYLRMPGEEEVLELPPRPEYYDTVANEPRLYP